MKIDLIAKIRDAATGPRSLICIAGPPASGKSTFAKKVREGLGDSAVVMPMDGFHLDNWLLDQRGLRAVKGAPQSFDVVGFQALLTRLEAREDETLIPVFDRQEDLSRAAARSITPAHKIVLVEGNYLLLKHPVWQDLWDMFVMRIFLDVPLDELEKRLYARWIAHGLTPEQAEKRAQGNDLVNARLVMSQSRAADLILTPDDY